MKIKVLVTYKHKNPRTQKKKCFVMIFTHLKNEAIIFNQNYKQEIGKWEINSI